MAHNAHHWVSNIDGSISGSNSSESSSKVFSTSQSRTSDHAYAGKILHQVFSSATSNKSGADATALNYLHALDQVEGGLTPADEVDTLEQENLTLHTLGHCRPCHYTSRNYGCFAGENCKFCHLQHDGVKRPRPSKSKRQQVKRVLDSIEGLREAQPDRFADMVGRLSEQNGYLRSVLRGREAAKRKARDREGQPEEHEADNSAPSQPGAAAAPDSKPRGAYKRQIGILEQIVANVLDTTEGMQDEQRGSRPEASTPGTKISL